jgi:benzoyl-CoA 2,3-epoxidase subunit A
MTTTLAAHTAALKKQHLIDPEVCIRCNTCEATCPVGAITHDDNNYVVDINKCNLCMDCISPCPTGSIDNWRVVKAEKPFSLDEQLGWTELPAQEDVGDTAGGGEQTGDQDVEALVPTQALVAR